MSEIKDLSVKVTAAHLAKVAYVYVRQSSLEQVLRHGESTELQYLLVERAVQLGWPRERIHLIDEDLGKSGTSAEGRPGFQELLAEIGLGRVGLVLSLDASRLARNNADWYNLLDLCSIFGTLLADGDRVYDPRLYADRMLLGLSGLMSEAELHQLKLRLQAGARHKAERGELRLPLPAGLYRQPDGSVILQPDEEVQGRIRLVFAQFQLLNTAKGVLRYCQRENLLLPTRPLRGPAPHPIIWTPARSSLILDILKNPAYAGAYVYGQTKRDPTRRQPGRPYTGIVRQPIDKWPIVIHNFYPAYITWEEFLANRAQLQANQSHYQEDKPGVPRKGQALLQGIIRCGRCGHLMRLGYSGSQGQFPVYECRSAQTEYGGPLCQAVRGLGLDAEVEQQLLAALEPDQLALALAALGQLEQEYAALGRQWQLRLERANYEAERARRQYHTVEPENRLVARSLEKEWENKLRSLEQVEQDYQTWLGSNRLALTPADRDRIVALGQDLPKVWQAPTTTPADRKQIVRLVIKEVLVDQKRSRGRVWFQINWQTGATTEHCYVRRVSSYEAYADLEKLQDRIRQLHGDQKMDAEMATILNSEGFRTAQGHLFTARNLYALRKKWAIPTVKPNGPHPQQWDDGTYSVEGAAAVLGVFPGTIYRWLKKGRLHGEQLAKGTPWKIHLNQPKIIELQTYLNRVRRSKTEVS